MTKLVAWIFLTNEKKNKLKTRALTGKGNIISEYFQDSFCRSVYAYCVCAIRSI